MEAHSKACGNGIPSAKSDVWDEQDGANARVPGTGKPPEPAGVDACATTVMRQP